jgi:hypothetical protein
MIPRLAAFALAASLVAGGFALAESPVSVALTLKDHRFTPDRITVPAGQIVRIELVNLDGAAEEFDSDDLHVEKDVTPHGRTSFTVGPLKAGAYAFMGELHADTASGEIVAVAR